MAATYEQWGPAAASTLSYYPSQPGSSYAAAYHLPGTSEYGDQQQVPVYGDAMNETYVREILSADAFYFLHACFWLYMLWKFEQDCQMTVTDPSMSSSWPLLGPSQTTQTFGSAMDATKLEGARMLLSGMDYSQATRQDEDGDTWVLL